MKRVVHGTWLERSRGFRIVNVGLHVEDQGFALERENQEIIFRVRNKEKEEEEEEEDRGPKVQTIIVFLHIHDICVWLSRK